MRFPRGSRASFPNCFESGLESREGSWRTVFMPWVRLGWVCAGWGLDGLNFLLAPKEGASRPSYHLAQVWGRREEGDMGLASCQQ